MFATQRLMAAALGLTIGWAATAAFIEHPQLQGDKAKDREAILSMAGTFKVSFDFEETQSYTDAEPSEPHHSSAHEIVLVLADTEDFISLQHILVVGEGLEQMAIKHWRQDWQYEDGQIHGFQGNNVWKCEQLPAALSTGAWSQTVYMVDDSPRYEGYGAWLHADGYSYWESNDTWRPLPRREHTKRDDYDVVAGRNRHAITADGWLHEQDNAKLALRDGKVTVIAREKGFNSYTRSDFKPEAGVLEDWETSAPFWAVVREEWTKLYAEDKTITIATIEDKNPFWRAVAEIGEEFSDGDITLDEARDQFKTAVAEYITLGEGSGS